METEKNAERQTSYEVRKVGYKGNTYCIESFDTATEAETFVQGYKQFRSNEQVTIHPVQQVPKPKRLGFFDRIGETEQIERDLKSFKEGKLTPEQIEARLFQLREMMWLGYAHEVSGTTDKASSDSSQKTLTS